MAFRATNLFLCVDAWQNRYGNSTTGVSISRLTKAIKNSKYLAEVLTIGNYTRVYILKFPDESLALFINRDFTLPFVVSFTPFFASYHHEWLYGYRLASSYYEHVLPHFLNKKECSA